MTNATAVSNAVASASHAHYASYHEPSTHGIDADLSKCLLRWYDAQSHLRKMPWRREISTAQRKTLTPAQRTQRAYEIWVSETMCQQTQVERVIPFYERWLATFPTVHDLARGDLEVVRGIWAGLGYYSRGSRLLAGAQKVVAEMDGIIPEDPKVLEKEVPGIGPYTAAAICSTAFGKRIAAVDGNVQRVLSRVLAVHANMQARPALNLIDRIAQEILPVDRSGEHNQALMDLGYSVCTPRNPKSKRKRDEAPVPVARDEDDDCTICVAFDPSIEMHEEGVTIYPMKKVRKELREEQTAVHIIETAARSDAERRVLVVQRPEKGLLAGQWEFVAVDMPPEDGESTTETRRGALRARLRKLVNDKTVDERLKMATERPIVRHVFSHQIRHYIPDSMDVEDSFALSDKRAKWASRSEVEQLHLGKAMRLMWEDHLAGKLRDGKKESKRRSNDADKPKAKKVKTVIEPETPITRFLVKKASAETQETVTASQLTSPKRKRVIMVSDEGED